ncbi:MAG: PAS domain S-box protein, partial [Chloroflexi bacterium]|nr:PAS domain S-box protein [Chloroflexota bacterium]
VAGIALSSVALYQATSVTAYALALKWQLACVYVVAIPLAWFIAYATAVRPIWLLLILHGMSILALAINITLPFGLFFTQIAGIASVMLPWGEHITYPIGTIVGPWVWLVRGLLVLMHLYAYYACYRQYRRGERRAALSLTLSLSSVLFARWHDHLALARGTPTLSWVEYGFLALIVVMSLGVLDDLIRVSGMKQELISNERRWRELLESVELAVVGLDHDGHIDYVNPYYLRLTGFARTEVLGRAFTVFVPERDRPRLLTLAGQIRAGTTFPPYVQLPLITSSASERTITWSNVRLRTPDDRFAGTLSIGADITDRITAETEIRALNAELEQRVASRTAELLRANNQLAQVARDNTVLYQRAVAASERLTTLYQASQSISQASLDLEQMCTELHHAVARLMPLDSFTMILIDHAGQHVDEMFLVGPAGRVASTRTPVENSLVSALLHHNASVRIDDVRTDLQTEIAHAVFGDQADLRSGVVVLLRGSETIHGVVCVQSAAPGAYRDEDTDALELLAAQAAIAIENARRSHQARDLAALAERTRLAHDLHDAVTQTLYSASLLTEALPAIWQRDRSAGERDAAIVRQLVRGALAEMRTLLFELRPTALVAADLGTLLRQLGDALTGKSHIPVDLAVDGEGQLTVETKIVVYRIAQEAFNNIAKHAGATQVWVTLRMAHDQFFLSVRDNGRGFDASRVTGDHLGTRIMAERAAGIGAQLHIDSTPHTGTEISLRWSDSATQKARRS